MIKKAVSTPFPHTHTHACMRSHNLSVLYLYFACQHLKALTATLWNTEARVPAAPDLINSPLLHTPLPKVRHPTLHIKPSVCECCMSNRMLQRLKITPVVQYSYKDSYV
jgi:hypothetical protein